MMRLRPRSQPSLRKDSTKASWKRAALAGVDSDAPERMPTRAIFVVWADTGTAMPPVSKAAPSAKTNLRRLMSTSREGGPALDGSEARTGVLRPSQRDRPYYSFRFLAYPPCCGPGGALGPVYLRVPVSWTPG